MDIDRQTEIEDLQPENVEKVDFGQGANYDEDGLLILPSRPEPSQSQPPVSPSLLPSTIFNFY